VDSTTLSDGYRYTPVLAAKGAVVYTAYFTDRTSLGSTGHALKLRRLDDGSSSTPAGIWDTEDKSYFENLDLAVTADGLAYLAIGIHFHSSLSTPAKFYVVWSSTADGTFLYPPYSATNPSVYLDAPSIAVDEVGKKVYIAVHENYTVESLWLLSGSLADKNLTPLTKTTPVADLDAGTYHYSGWVFYGQPAAVVLPQSNSTPGIPHVIFAANNSTTGGLAKIWDLFVTTSGPQIAAVATPGTQTNSMSLARAAVVTDQGNSSILKFWRERTAGNAVVNAWYQFSGNPVQLYTSAGSNNTGGLDFAMSANGPYGAAIWLDEETVGSGIYIPWFAHNFNLIYLPTINH
jgi:hypothetical protein